MPDYSIINYLLPDVMINASGKNGCVPDDLLPDVPDDESSSVSLIKLRKEKYFPNFVKSS